MTNAEYTFQVKIAVQETGGTMKPDTAAAAAALTAAGAERSRVEPWAANALRWVLWKLAVLAQIQPGLSGQLLCWEVVLDELKKRCVSA